jgi:hypothetical protein
MKKLILSLVAIATISLSSFGQSPEGFKYQAVVRDAGNIILNNQEVGMQLTILQDALPGTAVYTETFAPTTNAFGLVNLEIGKGSVVSGDFTTIDWSVGPYFIETAVDITGGTSYAVMGTSQLMSVPYALHAKTAESITGTVTYTETDPIFGASIANGITALDTANWNNHTVDTDTQLDSTGIAALGFVAGPHSDSTAIANMGFTANPCGLSIGDTYQGGIIFYIDASGCHGLIAAPTDQSTGIQWWNGSYSTTTATYDGVKAGQSNTKLIIDSQGDGTYAASICNDLIVYSNDGLFADWYLPSKYELNLLYQQKTVVGGFATSYYWSSTEYGNGVAWGQNFGSGNQASSNKLVTDYVRAVRAF